jgi:hypothetical protein
MDVPQRSLTQSAGSLARSGRFYAASGSNAALSETPLLPREGSTGRSDRVSLDWSLPDSKCAADAIALVAERADDPAAGRIRRSGRLTPPGARARRQPRTRDSSGPRSREGPSAKGRARGVRRGHLAQTPRLARVFGDPPAGGIGADATVPPEGIGEHRPGSARPARLRHALPSLRRRALDGAVLRFELREA